MTLIFYFAENDDGYSHVQPDIEPAKVKLKHVSCDDEDEIEQADDFPVDDLDR